MPPPELPQVQEILQRDGAHQALRFLNARTPHRFTGVYRYDGEMLRNELLYDRFAPEVKRGSDVAMEDAYCSIVGKEGRPVEFGNVQTDEHIELRIGSPVVSYCGVLIRDTEGQPYGTLCHYDTKPCQARTSDAPLLEAVAPLIFSAVTAG